MVEVVALDTDFIEVVTADTEHYAGRILHLLGEGEVAVLLQNLQCALDFAGEDVFASGEVVDVEQERTLQAVANGNSDIVADLLVDTLYLGQGRKFALEALDYPLLVIGRGESRICARKLWS